MHINKNRDGFKKLQKLKDTKQKLREHRPKSIQFKVQSPYLA